MRNLLLSFVLIFIYSNISYAQSRCAIDNFVAPSTTYTNIGPDGNNVTVYAKEVGSRNGATLGLIECRSSGMVNEPAQLKRTPSSQLKITPLKIFQKTY